jgi:hypothetical protein
VSHQRLFRAMTGTVLPLAEASIIARRNRTEFVLPRRTMCCSFWPSCSVSLRTLTGGAIPAPWLEIYVQPAQQATRQTFPVTAPDSMTTRPWIRNPAADRRALSEGAGAGEAHM